MGNINDTNNKLATDTPNTTTTTTTGGVSVTFSSPSNGPCNLTFTPDCGGTTNNNANFAANNARLATDTPDTTTTSTQQGGGVTIPGINFPYTFYPSEHGVDDIFGTYTFNCGGCEFIRNIERVCNDNDISYTVLGSSVTTTTTEDVTTTTTEDVTTTTTTEDVTTTTTTEDVTTTTTSSGCTNYMLKSGDLFTEFRYIKCGETNYTTEGLNRDQSRVVCSENVPIITISSDGAEVIDTGQSCTDIEITRFYISGGKEVPGMFDEGTNTGTGFCDNTYLLSGALWVVGDLTTVESLLNKTVYTNSDMDTFISPAYYYVDEQPGYPNGTYQGAAPGLQHRIIRVDADGSVGTIESHNCGDQGGGTDL